MRDHFELCRDVTTFLIIAFVSYPFAYMGVTGTPALIGKVICDVSLFFAFLCFCVKRPPHS